MRKLVKAIQRVYRSGEKGFTLIELLVVIGILAVLAGVVTLGVTQFIGRGGEEAACTELHNIQTAAAAAVVDAVAPTSEADLGAYLLTSAQCSYTIESTTGRVTAQDCSGTDPTWPECSDGPGP